MFEYLKGHLINKSDTECILEVNGAGYLLSVTPFITHHQGGQDVLLYVRAFVKDDGEYTFYGFQESRERQVFDFLREIKGIGPRTAMRILSRVQWDELGDLVKHEKIDILVLRSRLGEKTVRRIVMELKPRLEKLSWDDTHDPGQTFWQETRGVLIQLGFSSGEIDRVLRELARNQDRVMNTEQIVKEALALMGGKR